MPSTQVLHLGIHCYTHLSNSFYSVPEARIYRGGWEPCEDCLLAVIREVEATSDYSSKGGKVYISDTLLH